MFKVVPQDAKTLAVLLAEDQPRSLAGEDSAANDLCKALLPLLEFQVERRLVHVDAHDISTAEDAILMYLQNPQRFDCARGSLLTWLVAITVNRARDLHRRTIRYRRHEIASGVDLTNLAGTQPPERDASARPIEEIRELRRRLLVFARDSRERAFLEARLAGASMATQAVALGVPSLPADSQRRAVYRAMERLAKRGRRRSGP